MRDLRHGGARFTRRGPRRAASAVGVLLFVAALSGSSSARAGGSEPAPAGGPAPVEPHRLAASARDAPRTGGFYHGHLLPRLADQFKTLGPYEGLPARLDRPAGHLVFEEAARVARGRARRGARRALRGYLLESTPLGRLVGRVETKRAGNRPAASRASRLGLTIRHGLPVVELRRPLGRGLLRTGLSVDGRLRLEYRGGRFVGSGLRVDYDPRRGEFNFACRLGF